MERAVRNVKLFTTLTIILFFLAPWLTYIPCMFTAILGAYWSGVEEQIKHEEYDGVEM